MTLIKYNIIALLFGKRKTFVQVAENAETAALIVARYEGIPLSAIKKISKET